MAFSKARRLSDFIAADGTVPATKFATGTITSAMIADTSITSSDLHTSLNLTGKTVTVATAAGTTNTTAAASTAFVQQELTTLIGGAPSTLNDLNELAAAINDDANYNSTLTTALATKLPLAGGTMTGGLTVQSSTGQLRLQGTSNTNKNISIFYNESGDYGQINVDESGVNQKDLWVTGLNLKFGRNTSSESMRIDSSGRLLLGLNSATGYAADQDNFIIKGSAEVGMHIIGGASSTAAINFGDGTGTGAYRGQITYHNADDSMRLNTAATERMRIDASGNVGIGTDSPKRLMHLNNAAALTTKIQITNLSTGSSTDGDGFQIGISNDGTANIEQRENLALIFSTNNTERMRIDASGNVVIGTSSAYSGAKLSVAGSAVLANGNQFVIGTFGTSGLQLIGTAGGDNIVGTMGSSEPLLFRTGSSERMRITSDGNLEVRSGAALKVYRDTNAASAQLFMDAGEKLYIRNSYANKDLVFDRDGNLGIGIVPAGYETIGYALRLDGGTQTYLAFNNSTHTTQVLGGFVIGNDASAARITQREDQPMIFATDDTNRMTITADGVVSAPIASTHGGQLHGAHTPNPSASYLGSNGAEFGTTAIYRTPVITSSSSVIATSQFLTIYSSGHWSEYPVFKFKVYGTYYLAGYREYMGYMTASSAGLNAVETHGTATHVGGGGNNTITMGPLVSSGLAAHSGQPRYRRDFTLTNFGVYGRCYVVVEIMYGGNRYYGSNTTTANLDADGNAGGCYHFKTMSLAQGQGTFSTT